MSEDASEIEERITSGEAWSGFCDGLKSAGNTILSDSAPVDAIDRAEGFRYLTRLVRMGLDHHQERVGLDDAARDELQRPDEERCPEPDEDPDQQRRAKECCLSPCGQGGTRAREDRRHEPRTVALWSSGVAE